jgi:hypothetical protein
MPHTPAGTRVRHSRKQAAASDMAGIDGGGQVSNGRVDRR